MINYYLDNKEIIPYLNNNFDLVNMIDNKNHSLLYYAVINCNKKLIKILFEINRIRFHKNVFIQENIKKYYEKIIFFIQILEHDYKEKILKYAFKNNM